jgi:hypothetical protein
MRSIVHGFTLLCLSAFSLASAQDVGEINLETKLGSFKILRFNYNTPALGKLDITFSGTLLISGYKGKPIVMSQGIHKEFPDPKTFPKYTEANFEKLVLQGTGRVVLDGTYFAVQWFGKDMKAKWIGAGNLRLHGEFDANGDTGTYYFTDPTKKDYWPSGVRELPMPASMHAATGPKPRVRTNPPPGPKKP